MTLREIILKGRVYLPMKLAENADAVKEYRDVFFTAQSLLSSCVPFLVNAQTVMDDISPEGPSTSAIWEHILAYVDIPKAVPPHEFMWLEGRSAGIQNTAALVRRYKHTDFRKTTNWKTIEGMNVADEIEAQVPEWAVEAPVFVEVRGSVLIPSSTLFWIDSSGKIIRSIRFCVDFENKDSTNKINRYVAKMHTHFIMATLARMNCHNVSLSPIQNHKNKAAKILKNRGTVWHEIKVGEFPCRHRVPSNSEDGTSIERRLHSVRGHFADYSQGKGLFGNPKLRVVFWIPEHERGNEKAGEVLQTFTMEKR